MNANITVLKDENLSVAGRVVEREYREVKRKASVGERIKIVDASEFSDYGNGDTFVVERKDSDGCIFITDNVGDEEGVFDEEYRTLEPTDILRINSARFRMFDRKATVGERVIVVESGGKFSKAGDTARVISVGETDIFADLRENVKYYSGGEWYVARSKYRVLEPVESAETAPVSEPLSAKPAPDQAAELIAKLTTRVASLERRVTMLEVANAKPIPRRTAKPAPHPSFTKCAIKSPQEIRDDIVKRAKEDVAGLLAQNHPNSCVSFGVWLVTKDAAVVTDRVDFVVDREKRTVVALVTDIERKKVIGRGIAKCAPGDVFNVWIGRAISLRRALGLEIPEEYVSAPQPTEVRVGDVVEGTSHSGAIGPVLEIGHDGEENFVIYRNDTTPSCFSRCWSGVTRVIILDDSRGADGAAPRKEVA